MQKIYVKDVILKCQGKLILGNEETELIDFSKDTRTINKDDIYVGIKGEHFDGNSLYLEALAAGAKGCILNENVHLDADLLKKYPNCFIILVKDTIKCLQDLAAYKRSLYDIPVIGITGSVGKTSTKDIIASILGQKYNVLKTEGNYNNHIGLPLTILKLRDHNALVVEMGMINLGEISVLSKIARPTISVITNVGTAHIGLLKTRENILKAKLEILDGMNQNGALFINNDNDLLHEWYLKNKNKYKIITFGIQNESDYMAESINTMPEYSEYITKINKEKHSIKVNIPGPHFVLNSLCALSLGCYLNIEVNRIKEGIENFHLTERRMAIEKVNDITLINDCYNANLDSMTMAIKYLGSLKGHRKIAVLGDMLELGDFTEKFHRLIGQEVVNNKIDILITVGSNAEFIKDECLKLNFNKNNLYAYNSNKDAILKIKEILRKEDVVLIKASYGMNFMEIYNGLKEGI